MTFKDTHVARCLYRFQFTTPDMGAVEETLLQALLSIGCLHGEAAVRLDARYALDADKRAVVLDASTPIGRDVTRVFAGLCAHEFGDGAFRVEAVPQAELGKGVAA